MADLITSTSDPDLYARLLATANQEARFGHLPGYVMSGKLTYAVMQDSNHVTAFLLQSDRANYESTSLIS